MVAMVANALHTNFTHPDILPIVRLTLDSSLLRIKQMPEIEFSPDMQLLELMNVSGRGRQRQCSRHGDVPRRHWLFQGPRTLNSWRIFKLFPREEE